MKNTRAPREKSVKARWAGRLIREKLAAELNILQERNDRSPLGFQSSEPYTHDALPRDPNYEGRKRIVSDPDESEQPPRKVCIVGAGMAGLYIAMILDSLQIPNLTYEILEASSRVGGRVYTHHFSDQRHDYYDIGAMRYPFIPIMDRTFNLFERLNMPTIPYILNNEKAPKLFNDRLFSGGPDPYHVSVKNGGSVPDEVADNAGKILDDVFDAFKDRMAEDFDTGFAKLMEYDDFSTREYLKRMVGGPLQERLYNFFAIQWMETQDTSTNLFDQAFSESVMDSFDFDYPTSPEEPVKWFCIEGGTSVLSESMQKDLQHQPQVNKRVVAISIDWESQEDGNMSVKCADEAKPRTGYDTVFNTTTLGCLGRMDLRGLELHPSQKDAIRSLHYDESAKVALKFKYPWWIVNCGIRGGVGSTDLPLRTCVYPSYNLDDGSDKPAILLASYTWAQDATRMGSLVDRQPQPESEDELVELILRNLARLHAEHISYDQIKDAFTGDYHAYAWSHDPNTAGAFALFGPGQFSNLYPYLVRPAADSKFHIVGEASSAHHAWIVGALDSAYTAVYRFLYRFQLWDAMDKLREEWGMADELETGEEGTVHLQVMLGQLRKKHQYRV